MLSTFGPGTHESPGQNRNPLPSTLVAQCGRARMAWVLKEPSDQGRLTLSTTRGFWTLAALSAQTFAVRAHASAVMCTRIPDTHGHTATPEYTEACRHLTYSRKPYTKNITHTYTHTQTGDTSTHPHTHPRTHPNTKTSAPVQTCSWR